MNWRLESPEVLEQRLNLAVATGRPMPRTPARQDCTTVCRAFMLWAVGKSKNWFNQPNKWKKSREYEQDAQDRVFEVNP